MKNCPIKQSGLTHAARVRQQEGFSLQALGAWLVSAAISMRINYELNRYALCRLKIEI
jgi:hypothetical protein